MLNWNFKTDKIGEWKQSVHYNDEIVTHTFNMYSGNALAIMVHEFEQNGQDVYTVANFFCDKAHMKNCLGLEKGYENMFKTYDLEVTLYAEYKHTAEMVKLLAKADFDSTLKINIVPKAP